MGSNQIILENNPINFNVINFPFSNNLGQYFLQLFYYILRFLFKTTILGRGKSDGGGKKGDRMRGLMMLIQLKLAILGALALKFVALVAFKALILAKVALTISAIIALKKLLEHKQPTSTYEVVAHPHVDEWGHHSRSSKIDQLAYRGYEGGRSKS